jgi:hypothetical protein
MPIEPDTKVMQTDFGSQAGLKADQIMRTFSCQAKSMQELAVHGFNEKSDVDPFLWRLQSGDLTHQLFIDDGTHIVQGGVPPDPIVEALNIFKGSLPSLSSRLKVFTVNAFSFEAVKEALHGSIVVTITGTAHAHLNAFLL